VGIDNSNARIWTTGIVQLCNTKILDRFPGPQLRPATGCPGSCGSGLVFLEGISFCLPEQWTVAASLGGQLTTTREVLEIPQGPFLSGLFLKLSLEISEDGSKKWGAGQTWRSKEMARRKCMILAQSVKSWVTNSVAENGNINKENYRVGKLTFFKS
jgi:hypothetical protein